MCYLAPIACGAAFAMEIEAMRVGSAIVARMRAAGYLLPREIATLTDLHHSTVLRWAQAGRVPEQRMGAAHFYEARAFAALPGLSELQRKALTRAMEAP